MLSPRGKQVLAHPGAFTLRVLKAFRANKGMMLAAAVAYYALLSIVPLLILVTIGLSHLVDASELVATLTVYVERLLPERSAPILAQLENFLEFRRVVGGVLLVTLLFFSSLAFSVLENALSIVFVHRYAQARRHFFISALIPYLFVLVLGLALLVITAVTTTLQGLGEENLQFLGTSFSLAWLTGWLAWLVGLAAEILLIAAIYHVMPVGRVPMRHALIGATCAALLWEVVRHSLVWYFATLSQVGILYGSFTTAIVVLVSFNVAAAILLLGAQVISEYERILSEGTAPLAAAG